MIELAIICPKSPPIHSASFGALVKGYWHCLKVNAPCICRGLHIALVLQPWPLLWQGFWQPGGATSREGSAGRQAAAFGHIPNL